MFHLSKNHHLWSVPVFFDGGDSPFIANHLASLALFFPQVRAGAAVGDIILGLTKEERGIRIVYVFSVDQIVSWEKYSQLTRSEATYQGRIPKNIIDHGDSIYPPNSKQPLPAWIGRTAGDYEVDVILGRNVLLSKHYVYFGRGDQFSLFLPDTLLPLLPEQGYIKSDNEQLCKAFIHFLNETLAKNAITKMGKYGTPTHLPELEGFDFVMSCNTLKASDDGCGSQVEGRVSIDVLRDLQREYDHKSTSNNYDELT